MNDTETALAEAIRLWLTNYDQADELTKRRLLTLRDALIEELNYLELLR